MPPPAAPAVTRTGCPLLEAIILFVAVPMALFALRHNGTVVVIPALVVGALVCLGVLLADPTFPRAQLGLGRATWADLWPVLIRFLVLGGVLTAAVLVFAPELMFGFARRAPARFFLVLAAYPFLSVLPQTIIFRTFLLHRYRCLLTGPRPQIVASAAAFSFAHIVLNNWPAVGLTFIGGVMFAATYVRTRSTLVSALEHALYGNLIWTVGLGRYFYAGAVGT